MSENIPNKIVVAVKMIAVIYPDVVFCGSLGLVLNGLIDRTINDLDILTPDNWYNDNKFFPDERINQQSTSHKFMVGKDEVSCFSLRLNNVKVDVLYNESKKPEYIVIDFDGIKINVETPESAIDVKKKYILADKSEISIIKHLKDLILLGVDRKELIELIDKSWLCKSKSDKSQHSGIKVLPEADDLPF